MRREQCGGCGSPDLEPFLDLGSTPLADRFPKTPDEPEKRYPLQVAVCRRCWLVQLLEVVDDDVLWSDYGFYSGGSPSKVAYHEQYAAWALGEFAEQARRLTVEVGCNDGDLLRHFAAAGCDTVGIDPSIGPAKAAKERDLEVYIAPFTRAMGQTLADAKGPAGLVIANHVVAHQADLHDFLEGVAELLAPDGVAVVEVQYLPDLLAGNQFDHVYHEHRFFFSATSLCQVLLQHDLMIQAIIHTPQQGGSIRVVCRPAGVNRIAPLPVLSWKPPLPEGEYRHMSSMATYESFGSRVAYLRERLRDLLDEQRLASRRLAGYGATAKSTTLLNWCGIGPETLEYVEDVTPAKVGRFTPGTHIPIMAPGERERPDAFLLLAWNYLPGVLRRERAFMEQGGRFLVPIPVPVLL